MGGQVAVHARHDRHAIIQLAGRGELTAFVNAATSALADTPDDVELRLLLVHRLVEIGLLHAARRVASDFPADVRSSPDFGSLMRRLESERNNGWASWSMMAPRFAANLSILEQRYDWAGEFAESWREAQPRLELHRTRSGYWVVFEHDDAGGGRWRPTLGDHRPRETVAQLSREAANQILPPVVIGGMGMGDHLSLIHEASSNTFLGSAPAISLIEVDWIGPAVAMHLHDWRALLRDERVRLFIGPDAFERFQRACGGDSWLQVKPTLIQAVPWNTATHRLMQHEMDQLAAGIQARKAESLAEVECLYRGRDADYWSRRFAAARAGAEPPLRVLGITSRFTSVLQYSMRDALRSLEALGCQTSLVIEPSGYHRLSATPKLEAVREFEPDLILCIDHFRNGSPGTMIESVPFVTWIQDRLPWLFTSAAGRAIGSLDFCIGFCRQELIQQYEYPAERFMACEMATHPSSLYAEGSASDDRSAGAAVSGRSADDRVLSGPAERSALDCDLAYATNLVRTVEDIHQQARQNTDGPVRQFVDAVYDELRGRAGRVELNAGLDVPYFLASMQRQLGIELAPESIESMAAGLIRPLVDQLLRMQTIEWATTWAETTDHVFNLYGRGWESHLRYGRFARGFIEHGPALGEAFRRAKVHLHAGMNMAFHQRVLDGLGAGGFFLIREHANDLWHQFQPVLHEIIRSRQLGPGDAIYPADLPSALQPAWRRHRRNVGKPEDMPYELTSRHIEVLRLAIEGDDAVSPLKIWPQLGQVVFDSYETLCERLNFYIQRDDERIQCAARMRRQALENFSYKALMNRLLGWLTERLAGNGD